MAPSDLHELLVHTAHQSGFPLAGSVDLDAVLNDPQGLFQAHVNHLDQWLASGFAGSMEYLKRGRDRRANPRLVFPETQSLFCVGLPYPRRPAGQRELKTGPRYARYLQGPDYHEEITHRLTQVMSQVEAQFKKSSDLPLRWKITVDTSAVLERTWAALAGLGWIGKNTLLIHPKLGSYFFLAVVLLNQKTGQLPSPLPSLCGHCTRCLQGCPTGALEAPHRLNSNHCIAYLTLEKKGELQVPPSTEQQMGGWIAGCDLCQEACPFNLKPQRQEEAQLKPASVESLGATARSTWDELLSESNTQYQTRVKHSALSRIKPSQFRRNLALSLKNALQQAPEILELNPELFSQIQSQSKTETDPVAQRLWAELASSLSKAQSVQSHRLPLELGKVQGDLPAPRP